MYLGMISNYLPSNWSPMGFNSKDYELVDIPSTSSTYTRLSQDVIGHFNLGVSKIVRIQNPYLYGQFLLKKEEYETQGEVVQKRLYHDTAQSNIPFIASGNLDWRMAHRVKYGRGVSFSPSPAYANQESSRSNGLHRAMIFADVLIQNIYPVTSTVWLPPDGYDTTTGNCGQVYVKFNDNDFYPTYVAYYESRPREYRRRNIFMF